MRIRSTIAALLLTTTLAHAQAVSPLGGSTNNAGSAPPALATKPATPATPSTTAPATTTTTAPATTTPATTAPATTPASTPHARRTFDERFAAANTTHDGKLTLDQAKAGHLRAVARDFAVIDKSKKGYVTLDEVKAHQASQRAARKAARDAKKPS